MKILKGVLCIVLLCSACIKVGVHAYRHFHLPAAITVGP